MFRLCISVQGRLPLKLRCDRKTGEYFQIKNLSAGKLVSKTSVIVGLGHRPREVPYFLERLYSIKYSKH